MVTKRAPARRARGRPTAGAGSSRGDLLDAALSRYARQGIAASSLRDIAADAGVTPASLHYYFIDAAGLRDAVLAERLLPVFEEAQALLVQRGEPAPGNIFVAFVERMCELVARHDWLPALWIREVVSEGGGLRDWMGTQLAPGLSRLLAARIAEEQAAGRLNPGLDPRLLMVSLVGLTLFPAAGLPIWRPLLDADDLGIDDIRRHALALLERGLETSHE
ncbi:TetR/AcrR family transcriptional regulator [Luteimonas sp. MC1572]|uniref:TetR/AcrR family transcriptional regulator n=1 Tax=Luteimonas sp. MC1572 TaxID=2799325 RepID=UPI0018F0A15A|nr:TetR/AcrR family transcriptional regulator [Luteimonas sp. MC1572]MBJ6982599.1 TetR/AcrR family transcriptional regulator [Luteimonas sp. MC1572]QQO03847.1 TetR/AcrR family transcriptional regulator [Luteimonas sp. MC1572]